MIDVLLRVVASDQVYGPFETWEEVMSTARRLHSDGAGEVVVYRENFVCDFCSDPSPKWDYAADDTIMMAFAAAHGAPEIHASRGAWAACEPCKELIEAEEWNALMRRSAESYRAKYGNLDIPFPVITEMIASAHTIFRRVRKGEPIPIPADEDILGRHEEQDRGLR